MAAAGLPRGMWNVESLVATCELFRDLVPRPGLELGPPAVGVRSPSHLTTREVPYSANFLIQTVHTLASLVAQWQKTYLAVLGMWV